MPKNIKGFTIVELLIVIVVIGILAAITIIAYTGIQDRARAAQVVSAFDSWETILRSYKALSPTSSYPILTGDQEVCLGESFPADNIFTNNQCFIGSSYSDYVDTTLMAQLKAIATKLPAGVIPLFNYPSIKLRGIIFQSDGNTALMAYFVNGTQQCGRGTATYVSGVTECMLYLQ